MAEALWRLRGGRTRLLTAVGDDADGQYLDRIAPGLLLDGCIIKGGRTASYAVMLDSRGECLLGLGDMALHNYITPDLVNKHMNVLKQAPLVVLDGNAPQATIDHVLAVCERLKKPVFYEPTDRRKASKVLHKRHAIKYASPNLSELREMANTFNSVHSAKSINYCDITEIIQLSRIVSSFIDTLIITIGSKGVITIRNKESKVNHQQVEDKLTVKLYPAVPLENIENVSGAGDSFSSGVIHGILSGLKESQCISLGFSAAKLTLMSKNTVSSDLNSLNISDVDEADCKLIN